MAQRRFRLIKGAFRHCGREPPEDPYAYVMAHRKPRPGGRSAAAVMDEPDR